MIKYPGPKTRAFRGLTLDELVRLHNRNEIFRWADKCNIGFAHEPTNFIQTDFIGLEDDSGLGSASTKAAANTNWTQDVDENFRIRFSAEGANDGNFGFAPDFQLQYNHDGGGWNDVTGSSLVVRSSDDGNSIADNTELGTDGNPDGNSPYTGSFADSAYEAGHYDDIDGTTDEGNSIGDAGWTECEFCVQIRSDDVDDEDTIQLRVRFAGSSEERAGETLSSYTNTPSITVNEGVAAIPPPLVMAPPAPAMRTN